MTTILDPEPALHNDRPMTFLSFIDVLFSPARR
jgi:hypothetical protein